MYPDLLCEYNNVKTRQKLQSHFLLMMGYIENWDVICRKRNVLQALK